MDEIREIADKYGLFIIEDACQAQGAVYKGKMAGSLGDIGCLSFYPGKVMTTGEGGALLVNDEELGRKIRMIRTHGQIKGYDSVILGGNFRMPEINAAIGLVQLRKLPNFLEKRGKNAKLLMELLEESNVILSKVPEYSIHNWYLFTIRLKNEKERNYLKEKLLKEGIQATVYYPTPIHKLPYYKSIGYGNLNLPNSELASKTVLSLPVHPLVREEDIERMSKIILSSIN